MIYASITNSVKIWFLSMVRYVAAVFFISFCLWTVPAHCEPMAPSSGMGFGIPVGSDEDDRVMDVCPQGARVINMFLNAWYNDDYRAMYELIDDTDRADYSFDQARFDFQFMEFVPYNISSVRKVGDNYEFVLSYGDWKSGDKDVKKMIIDGRTFKIKMPSRGSVFKRSVESYF